MDRVLYGVSGNYMDVTYICWKKLVIDGRLCIPVTDPARGEYFGDPLPGILKHIKIGEQIWSHQESVNIPFNCPKNIETYRENWWKSTGQYISDSRTRLNQLHEHLCINWGKIQDEYPEQLLAMTYIKKDDIVLEIGGNIGRNSCVIGTILSDSSNLLVLESSPNHAIQLKHNREQNYLNFRIVPAALSAQRLMQREWITKPVVETIPEGWSEITTINYEELQNIFGKKFNVLVLDCEGAIEHILNDYPQILNNIETIIIENDFTELAPGKKVHEQFRKSGLEPIFNQSGGWGPFYNIFFQVWKKIQK